MPVNTQRPLTPKQKHVFDFICSFLDKNEYPPSLQEIAKHFHRSISTAQHYVEELKIKGYLRKEENLARSIKPVDQFSRKIFLLGYIAAGNPIEPFENPEPIKIPPSMINSPGDYYALKVKGNSMIDDGICDGDTIVVKHQATAEPGDMVVAITEKGATLKIFKRKGGRIFLEPRNKKLKNIYPEKLEIRGKFVGLIRRENNQNQDKKRQKKPSALNLKNEFHKATIAYMEKTNLDYRKSRGQYFTPRSIREKLLRQLPVKKNNPKILDPACGTGEFLLSANKFFKNPQLYGWDIEESLIKASRLVIPRAKLKVTNSLKERTKEKFDFVIGNPPYFEFRPEKSIKNKFQAVINGRPNIFALFIKLGLDLLKKGGYLAYVLPPSMNNGAYFNNLRKYIVKYSNIEYLSILKSPKLFHQALQTTMLLVLKKGKNKDDYVFRKNGLLIFSEKPEVLKKAFKGKTTLYDLNYTVKTGRLVWNQNKKLLTNNPEKSILLIWAHNITSKGLHFSNNPKKPQYVKIQNYDTGPAIVVNRITGAVNSTKLKAAIIPENMKFIGENHVNVIFPPSKNKQLKIIPSPENKITLENLVKQLKSKEKLKVIQYITGNTQISKTELENLFPLDPS